MVAKIFDSLSITKILKEINFEKTNGELKDQTVGRNGHERFEHRKDRITAFHFLPVKI